MKFALLLLLLIAVPTFACPDLTGLYKGPEAWGDKFNIEINQTKECGITTFTLAYFYGAQVRTFKADGNPVNIDTEKFKGTQKNYCEKDFYIYEEQGENFEGGIYTGSTKIKSFWSLNTDGDLQIESHSFTQALGAPEPTEKIEVYIYPRY